MRITLLIEQKKNSVKSFECINLEKKMQIGERWKVQKSFDTVVSDASTQQFGRLCHIRLFQFVHRLLDDGEQAVNIVPHHLPSDVWLMFQFVFVRIVVVILLQSQTQRVRGEFNKQKTHKKKTKNIRYNSSHTQLYLLVSSIIQTEKDALSIVFQLLKYSNR